MQTASFLEVRRRTVARVDQLRILNAGWEGGDTYVQDKNGTPWILRLGAAGGMGVVIPQLPVALLHFAKQRGLHWSCANAVPLFGGIIRAVRKEQGNEVVLDLEQLKSEGLLTDTGWEWTIPYESDAYRVRVWQAQVTHPVYPEQLTCFLLQQDDLWGPGKLALIQKEGARPELDLYEVPDTEDPFPLNVDSTSVSSEYAMARFQRIRYLVFARSLANLYNGITSDEAETTAKRTESFDLLISHDFHAGLATFFAESPDKPIRQFSIGHNLGYQGVDAFYQPDGPSANLDCRDESNWESLKAGYARATGLERQVVDDYLLAWSGDGYLGTPDWTQGILRKNFYLSGLAMTAVSPGYAMEQRRDREAVLTLAGKDVSDPGYTRAACRDRLQAYFRNQTLQNDLFVPNQNLSDLLKYTVVGVLNGMFPSTSHLLESGKLKRLVELPDVKELGRNGLVNRPGLLADVELLESLWGTRYRGASDANARAAESGFEQQFDNAASALQRIKDTAKIILLKASGFQRYFLNPASLLGKPILFAWGRLVSQKAFHILYEAVKRKPPCLNDVVVVVLGTAPNGDKEARVVEAWFNDMTRETNEDGSPAYPNFVFVNKFDTNFRDICLLAADGAIQTSLYEPCGLTDTEAYWSGTPCIVHDVGGLTKGLADPERYTQISQNLPLGEPVAESYRFYDNTEPRAEAEAFAGACERFLRWEPVPRRRRQLKALTLMQFSYEIPANRYIDLLQFVWLNQVWRWLKDQEPDAPIAAAVEFIRDRGNGFVAGNTPGCSMSLEDLYRTVFLPPERDIGVADMDRDCQLDRELEEALR